MKKKKLFLLSAIGIVGVFTACTYGKWELLTMMYGREFEHVFDNQGFEKTKFLKVLSYSGDKANILMQEDGGNLIRTDISKKEIDGKKKEWYLNDGNVLFCTQDSRASQKCVFPWYGGFPKQWDLWDVVQEPWILF